MWRLLKWFFLALAIMFCGEMIVLAAARLTYHDPFAPYRTIMPGQPTDALKSYTCQRPIHRNSGLDNNFCQIDGEDDIVDEVIVTNSNHLIATTVFIIEPDTLRLGDLVLCWGKPIYTNDYFDPETSKVDLYWDNQAYARVMVDQAEPPLNYFLPVSRISIERQWGTVEYEKLKCTLGQ